MNEELPESVMAEIYQLASFYAKHFNLGLPLREDLRSVASLAFSEGVKAERERAAKVCEQEDQRGAAADPQGESPESTQVMQSALHPNAGTPAQRTVAESQAPAPSEPGDRGVAPTLDAARPALPGPMVSVPREPTEAMIDAPRQIILYAETRGRTLEGLREHLDLAGVEFHSWFPEWAITERGHLTKAAIAILVYRAMLAAGSGK